jgi:geranylgeranyl diphosphate synthase type II
MKMQGSDFSAVFKEASLYADKVVKEQFGRYSSGINPVLREVMEYSLFSGGKRVRPVLMMWCAELGRPDDKKLHPAMAAIEFIHTYSLIHDDLPCMDDDDERRGKPTAHVRYGEAMAVLAGDGLLTDAFMLLADTGTASSVREMASCAGSPGMVGGQAADIRGNESKEETDRKKTGALFVASAAIGAEVGGFKDAELDKFRSFGLNLGRAFQLRDDVLDGEYSDLSSTMSEAEKCVKAASECISGFRDSGKLIRLAEFMTGREI